MFSHVCELCNRYYSSGGRPLSGEGFSNNLIITISYLHCSLIFHWEHLCSSVKAVEAHSYLESEQFEGLGPDDEQYLQELV